MLMMKQTLLMSSVTIFNPARYLIVFLSTIFVYQVAASSFSFPFKLSRIHKSVAWIGMMCVLITAITMLAIEMLNLKDVLFLSGILILCFSYFTAIGKWKGLRAIPAVKAILLAMAWSLVTVIFPVLNDYNRTLHFDLLVQRFLFMLPICIIYNLRDVDKDRRHGVVTLAIIAGEKKTKLIAVFCLLLFMLSVVFNHQNNYFKAALMFSALITIIVIAKAKINGSELFYKYIVDGCMSLQSILLMGAVFFVK